MRIPAGPNGLPTVSASQLRTYGAPGFELEEFEASRGCPRQYKARYIDKIVKRSTDDVLLDGGIIHKAFELLEQEPQSPEDALMKAWDIRLGDQWYAEALEDLRRYMDRPSNPRDRYYTLATEKHLTALLYVDEDFGPIYFQGYVDVISVDPDLPSLLHLVDYKTNRTPPSVDDIRKDAQGKAYCWLALQNADELLPGRENVRVVFHLDAIKWSELPPVYFNEADLEAWHSWAVAVVRHILRDEAAEPVINPGCARCPVWDTCPAFLALPDLATELAAVKPDRRDELAKWWERANAARLLLENAAKATDDRFKVDAAREGEVRAGGYVWAPTVAYRQTPDIRRLHSLVGERIYDLCSVTKAKLNALAKELDPSLAEQVLGCIRDVPSGTKIERKKEKP
jgi:hypothetical protein